MGPVLLLVINPMVMKGGPRKLWIQRKYVSVKNMIKVKLCTESIYYFQGNTKGTNGKNPVLQEQQR
jgi:hypothetical protein